MPNFRFKQIKPAANDHITATRYEVSFDDFTIDGYTFIGRVYRTHLGTWYAENNQGGFTMRHEAALWLYHTHLTRKGEIEPVYVLRGLIGQVTAQIEQASIPDTVYEEDVDMASALAHAASDLYLRILNQYHANRAT